ncbi:hypothetical protein [Pseudonocardia broussonetiae]|uniref:Uncharacterized protein n=1 Tax=Pseudonocardia broussonetiae TaxID=2736640 RepID=A0A6M6JFB8_9PSEU|nr:hypothetical protein [Pseudonocardia broussonetiae]QJY46678.1 hypothetical protein HOP40_13315 [Pseudonocardia broussonetiae]
MSLTDDEIKIVLAVAMSYDNRKLPGEANRMAWVEASRRANWTVDAAVEAVHEHYSARTDFVMPGHITQLIRAERRQPAPYQPPPPRPAVEAAVRDALPSVDDPAPPRPLIARMARRARRPRMTAEDRARIAAELDAKRPAAEGEAS